jgi:hypothetical protein
VASKACSHFSRLSDRIAGILIEFFSVYLSEKDFLSCVAISSQSSAWLPDGILVSHDEEQGFSSMTTR